MKPITTAMTGTNADLLPRVFDLYVPVGSTVADVTYGRGVFWQQIDDRQYHVLRSDITDGVDLRCLPYPDGAVDVLILDPPYMHGGATVKESINKVYRNQNGSHASVIRLYAGGLLEAARVLRKGGRVLVKCQDETESGRQRMSHVEILGLLEMFGFRLLDLFVLVQNTTPAMREEYQKSARKNHSYLLVAELRNK